MSYGVVLSDEAIEDLNRLPLPVRRYVEQQLARLAEDPVTISRPSHFPYPQGQMHRCETELDGVRYFVFILFRYTQDEQNLFVFAIGVQMF